MWFYVPIYEILFGIIFFGVCYYLFDRFWQFRLLCATLGIIFAAFLPVISIYLAYISITEESLFPGIIVAGIQLVLGWTVGAIPLYICAKPYLNYVKECFEKTEIKQNPYTNEMKEDFLSEKPLAKATEQAAEKVLKKQEKDKPLSKQEMEEAIRMGTKLADLGTLHNLESRTKASLEKNIDKDNPYLTERRNDFLSEKILANRLSKKLEELAKKNKE